MMLPYLRGLVALLPRDPGAAARIAWWWLTGRRVRALAQFRRAVTPLPNSYRLWLAIHQPETFRSKASIDGPRLAVHVHLTGSNPLNDALSSLVRQSFEDWELYLTTTETEPPTVTARHADDRRIHFWPVSVASRAAGLKAILQETAAQYVVPLPADCVLTLGALLAYAHAIRDAATNAVFYADQDEYGASGSRTTPWLKPEWDRDLFLAQDYLSMACAIPVEAARNIAVDAGWPDEIAVYGILIELLACPDAAPARHVPYVATTTPPDVWQRGSSARAALVANHVGVPVTTGPFGTLILHWPLPDPLPRVSIVIPTRDRIDLLRTCVDGILHATDYPLLELIIADNDSTEPASITYFNEISRDPRVKIVRWPHPYNYSAINNHAVTHAGGDYICLLNNDVEIIDPSWLREMIAQAIRPGVAAVGARLLYADRSVQHAGVVVGIGDAAGHAHRALADGQPGWFAQSLITRCATAVTAACLVIEKAKFDAVGGLDAESLAIAYNDVDLCLKLRAAGWHNIYASQAVLIHHESKSRGFDFAPEHITRYHQELLKFQERWQTVGFADPTHHPKLDPQSEQYRPGL
ncbi:glycosyltransferase family 2 protein [Sphingomonas montana]|uniref:glycosyltransferase family 2 protein n=1 Tax=Sphingomonas montana TaxID=1843236 RepID=UPI0009F8E52D|nr:glycosyltransferase family 2 protein [Sphingomonas montana]